jgi:hypothetical protein
MTDGSWSCLRGLRRILFAGTALMMMCGPPNTALAEDATINELSFTIEPSNFPSTINVTASGTNKWDTIMPGNVTFSAHMKVDTAWPGYVEQVGIFLGQCDNHQCGNGYPILYYSSDTPRHLNRQQDVTFPTTKIPVSGPGIAVVPYGDEILLECNKHLTADGPTREHVFTKQMTASFSVNTRKSVLKPTPGEVIDPTLDPDYNGGEVTRQAQFTAKVVCQPKPMQQTSQLQVGNIELFQSTYANQISRPNAATECKKVRVLVRLETNREGPVKFNLWTKIGEGPSTRKYIDAWASPDGAGYKAEYAEWVEVTKTTVVQSMAEDLTNPIGQSTGWKDITLHCTGVGGGGLASPTNDPNQSTAPPRLVAGTTATPPGVSCIGGTLTGSVCTCRPPSVKVVTGLHAWRCVMDDLKTDTGAAPQRLVGPANTTPPTISCIGGLSTGSTCVCRQPTVKVQTGQNSYRCVMKDLKTGTVAPQRLVGPANTTPPAISCIGGISTGTTCFCRPPTVKVQTGPNSFRCVMDGMTTGVGPVGPFGRVDNRPHFLVGPPAGQPIARPLFNRQSALPTGGMMR